MFIPAIKQVLILMMAITDHSDDKFDFANSLMAQNMMRTSD